MTHVNSFRIDLNSILSLLSSEQSLERYNFILASIRISEKAHQSGHIFNSPKSSHEKAQEVIECFFMLAVIKAPSNIQDIALLGSRGVKPARPLQILHFTVTAMPNSRSAKIYGPQIVLCFFNIMIQ